MKTIVFALPGRYYSGNFLVHWSQTLVELTKLGYKVHMINEYSSFVPFSRMKTLGLDVRRGYKQKPFNGEIEYDIWFSIDADMFFLPEQVLDIIEDLQEHKVVSGIYRMEDLKHFAAVKDWDLEYYKKVGSFKFLTQEDIDPKEKYMKVVYNGMGFFACRREVLEDDKLLYPYFSYPLLETEGENGVTIKDTCSEDVAFCKNLTDAGYDIMVNTTVRVGHEKTLVI